MEEIKTETSSKDDERKDNRVQFMQRRMVEKIERMAHTFGLPKLTCIECDESMLIIANNQKTYLAQCSRCNFSVLID